MATFTEYPPHTTASSNVDFTLFPYQDLWNSDPSYPAMSTYAEQSYLTATTYDSYLPHQTYAPLPEHFDFAPNASFDQAKPTLQEPSSTFSPANSASHPYDYQNPPILSSTSDSGQSTISSAMGSPSAQPPSTEWSQQRSLNVFPSIVQQPDSLFGTTGFDLEPMSVTDKGCVGELTADFSSFRQKPQSASHLHLSGFSSTFNHASIPRSFPQSTSRYAMSSTPRDPTVHALSTAALPPMRSSSLEALSPKDSVFLTPTTPASASSPVIERVKAMSQGPVSFPSSKRARESSPTAPSTSSNRSDVTARPQAPPPASPSHFFSQSSGYFVPPLESSCPSPFSPFRISAFFLKRISITCPVELS